MSLAELKSFGAALGPFSDLLGLRLPLPLQSRPAQIYEGTQGSTERQDPPQTLRCFQIIPLVLCQKDEGKEVRGITMRKKLVCSWKQGVSCRADDPE